MATPISAGQASKGKVVLTLDDILSDLDKLPLPAEPAQALPLSAPSDPYTRHPLPASSLSVDTSIELSQRFIESSKRVLKDTEALDAVRAGLTRVDSLLDQVEQGVQPQERHA